jgi:hypothetical protein
VRLAELGIDPPAVEEQKRGTILRASTVRVAAQAPRGDFARRHIKPPFHPLPPQLPTVRVQRPRCVRRPPWGWWTPSRWPAW